MHIWIDQTPYELRCHHSEEIHVVPSQDNTIAVIYAPPECSLERIRQYLRWRSEIDLAQSNASPAKLRFDYIEIFDQRFPIQLLSQKQATIKLIHNRIFCDHRWYHRVDHGHRAECITRHVFEQYILQLVSRWEEHLEVMAGRIKFRKMSKNLFKVDIPSGNIVFNRSNSRFPIRINEWLVANAMVSLCSPEDKPHDLIVAEFPDYKQLERTIQYESKGNSFKR